jgi:hypothetical protein
MNDKTTPRLTSAQLRALEALMTSATVQDAAEAAGVGRRTLHRWLETEPFRAALRQLETEALQGVSRRLSTLAAQSIDVLQDVLTSDESRPVDKLQAAKIVLTSVTPLKELADFGPRLEDLECRVNAATCPQPAEETTS